MLFYFKNVPPLNIYPPPHPSNTLPLLYTLDVTSDEIMQTIAWIYAKKTPSLNPWNQLCKNLQKETVFF